MRLAWETGPARSSASSPDAPLAPRVATQLAHKRPPGHCHACRKQPVSSLGPQDRCDTRSTPACHARPQVRGAPEAAAPSSRRPLSSRASSLLESACASHRPGGAASGASPPARLLGHPHLRPACSARAPPCGCAPKLSQRAATRTLCVPAVRCVEVHEVQKTSLMPGLGRACPQIP